MIHSAIYSGFCCGYYPVNAENTEYRSRLLRFYGVCVLSYRLTYGLISGKVTSVFQRMTILMFLLAGILRAGILMIGAPDNTGCDDVVCQPVVVESSCCGEPAAVVDMDEYCPMSGGPCRCGVTPGDDRSPAPDAPLQRSETQITLGFSTAPVQICVWTVSSDEHSTPMAGLVGNLHALRTHTETQAILGIWRT